MVLGNISTRSNISKSKPVPVNAPASRLSSCLATQAYVVLDIKTSKGVTTAILAAVIVILPLPFHLSTNSIKSVCLASAGDDASKACAKCY